MEPVCAVVVNWKGWRDTVVCLDSLLGQQGAALKILVCDNGSSNGSVEAIEGWLRDRLPAWRQMQEDGAAEITFLNPDTDAPVQRVRVLGLPANAGYAGGLNAGIRWAQAHWAARRFWLLNNDLRADPTALRAMLDAHASVPHAGLCGSVLLDWDTVGTVQAVCGIYRRWLAVGWHLTALPADTPDPYLDVDYPVGASLYVEQDYLERVGFMDEGYFLYYEEMDWVERGHRHGFRPLVALRSRLWHKEGASTGSQGSVRNKSLLSERYGVINRLRITRKLWPLWLPVVWLSLWVVTADRLVHREFRRAGLVLRLMFSPRLWL